MAGSAGTSAGIVFNSEKGESLMDITHKPIVETVESYNGYVGELLRGSQVTFKSYSMAEIDRFDSLISVIPMLIKYNIPLKLTINDDKIILNRCQRKKERV